MFGGREEPSLQETAKRGNVLSLSAITASRSTRSTSVSSSQPASPNTSSFRLDSTQQLGAARPLQTVKANRFSDVLTARNHRPRVSSHEKESRPSTSSHGVNHSKEKDNGDAASSFNLDADPFAKTPVNRTHSQSPMELEQRHQKGEASAGRKQRASLLVVASDALGFGRVGSTFSKRKVTRSSEEHPSPSLMSSAVLPDSQSSNSTRQQRTFLPWKGKPKGKGHWALRPPSSTQIMSDVIEISAANAVAASVRDDDEEIERQERDRLREAAAESIGISPLIREDASSRLTNSEDNFFDDDETQDGFPVPSIHEDVEDVGSATKAEAEHPSLLHRLQRSGLGARTRHGRSSSLSGLGLPALDSSPLANNVSLTLKSSLPPSLHHTIPPFPSTLRALEAPSNKVWQVLKFYPLSTLLSRGLSRSWRNRTLVFTSYPSPRPSGLLRSFSLSQDAPSICFLHLFKSAGTDERELERIEVPTASAGSFLDGEFAGRRFVVKISGSSGGGATKETVEQQRDQAMWLISFPDSKEAESLIATLKGAFTESKRDQVMLGMPSGLVESTDNLDSVSHLHDSLYEDAGDSHEQSAPRRSISPTPTARSWAGDGKSRPVRMVSLKGLFSVPGRTRSMSHSNTVNEEPPSTPNESSFASRGALLLNFMRSGGAQETGQHIDPRPSPSSPLKTSHDVPVASIIPGPIISAAELEADRLNSKDREKPKPDWYSIQLKTPVGSTLQSASQSGSALLPPPRARRTWTPTFPAATHDHAAEAPSRRSFQSTISLRGARLSVDGSRNSAESFRAGLGMQNGFDSPSSQRPSRSSSLSSSRAPSDNGQAGISSSALHRRRMSKLPTKLAPPAGPLPSVPVDQEGRVVERQKNRSPSFSESINTALPRMEGGRRQSTASDFSSQSAGTSQSQMSNLSSMRRSFSAKRRSILPPQHPAPDVALPPTPSDQEDMDAQSNASSKRLSFRDAISNRSLRFSTSHVPSRGQPRPLDPLRRRSLSSGNTGAVGASPNGLVIAPPAPPPTGPLPPTPDLTSSNRSLRERLRMRSAPSNPMGIRGNTGPPTTMPGSLPLVTVSSVSSLKSEAKLGEPIIPKDSDFLIMASTDSATPDKEDDTNFLNLSSPVAASYPIEITSPQPTEEHYPNHSPTQHEMTVLPAPPRRNRAGTLSRKDSEQAFDSTFGSISPAFPTSELTSTA